MSLAARSGEMPMSSFSRPHTYAVTGVVGGGWWVAVGRWAGGQVGNEWWAVPQCSRVQSGPTHEVLCGERAVAIGVELAEGALERHPLLLQRLRA